VDSKETLRFIQQCISEERYTATHHFRQRMDERGLFLTDALAVIDAPDSIRDDGLDDQGRPKWLVAGLATELLSLEIVVVIDLDESGNEVLLITIYFED
jgi:uncharacterized DUF497 family protein